MSVQKNSEHIKREWMSFAARMQGMHKKHIRTSAIYKVTILVGEDGLPHFYTRPRVIALEPRSIMMMSRLRKVLEGSDFSNDETKKQIAEMLELLSD